jgi:3-deoxy-7-phosphoheptulonate synthase
MLESSGGTPPPIDNVRIRRIRVGDDDRLLVVVGPCSIHDVAASSDYAARLKIVMLVYFEKLRTNVGWKGLINDAAFDGSFQINRSLEAARGLLLEIARIGWEETVELLHILGAVADPLADVMRSRS